MCMFVEGKGRVRRPLNKRKSKSAKNNQILGERGERKSARERGRGREKEVVVPAITSILLLAFKQHESLGLDSRTVLLTALHTPAYCPRGHRMPKYLKSPECKLGFFFPFFFFKQALFKATPGALSAPWSATQ